jgi:hypothetical protein
VRDVGGGEVDPGVRIFIPSGGEVDPGGEDARDVESVPLTCPADDRALRLLRRAV